MFDSTLLVRSCAASLRIFMHTLTGIAWVVPELIGASLIPGPPAPPALSGDGVLSTSLSSVHSPSSTVFLPGSGDEGDGLTLKNGDVVTATEEACFRL